MVNQPIYLDYNATTPCDPRVIEKMLPYFGQVYANPANSYNPFGRAAARAIDQAREQVASLIGAQPGELFFTSGATESNNLAILGLARRAVGGKRRRIVTSAVEHKAVLLPCKQLQAGGFELVVLPVDRNGRVLVEAAREAITDDTLLVSIQAANNEVGTLQPIQELAALAHERGALFHCDAAQAVGKVPVNVDELGVDLLSASAHKLYGPKGIGALYTRDAAANRLLEPLYYGGGQERGLRSGTSNVPAIVGFGEACAIAGAELGGEAERIEGLRDLLEQELARAIPTVIIHAQQALRLPNTSSVALPGIDGDALLLNLPDVMMGLGSACNSGSIEPSHVLEAMGVGRELAHSTVRISLGRFTTQEDVTQAGMVICETCAVL
jgi:cysteine desulfurase